MIAAAILPLAAGDPQRAVALAGMLAILAGLFGVMAGLLRRGREAREVMAILERTFAGVQRNDPCPCGSGRKFKQCHGR